MKTLNKICFFIIFLTLTLLNCVNACDITSSYQIHSKSQIYQFITEHSNTESYIAVIPKSFDNELEGGFETTVSDAYIQKFIFNTTQCINYNITIIAFLFKTEIFPNAP